MVTSNSYFYKTIFIKQRARYSLLS